MRVLLFKLNLEGGSNSRKFGDRKVKTGCNICNRIIVGKDPKDSLT